MENQQRTEDLEHRTTMTLGMPEDIFNFGSDNIFYRDYKGYSMNGRKVNANLQINRNKGILEFKCIFKYDDNKPVLTEEKTDADFAHSGKILFSVFGLREYAEKNKISLPLGEEYSRLNSEKEDLEKEILSIKRYPRFGKISKSRKARKIKNEIDHISDRMDTIYAESALKTFGFEWLKGFDETLKTFVETDGSPVEYGGDGNGPYLQNWVRLQSIPNHNNRSYRRLPGCYEAGSRSR